MYFDAIFVMRRVPPNKSATQLKREAWPCLPLQSYSSLLKSIRTKGSDWSHGSCATWFRLHALRHGGHKDCHNQIFRVRPHQASRQPGFSVTFSQCGMGYGQPQMGFLEDRLAPTQFIIDLDWFGSLRKVWPCPNLTFIIDRLAPTYLANSSKVPAAGSYTS